MFSATIFQFTVLNYLNKPQIVNVVDNQLNQPTDELETQV